MVQLKTSAQTDLVGFNPMECIICHEQLFTRWHAIFIIFVLSVPVQAMRNYFKCFVCNPFFIVKKSFFGFILSTIKCAPLSEIKQFYFYVYCGIRFCVACSYSNVRSEPILDSIIISFWCNKLILPSPVDQLHWAVDGSEIMCCFHSFVFAHFFVLHWNSENMNNHLRK